MLENIINNWLNEGDETDAEVEQHRSNSKATKPAKNADSGKTFNKIDDAFADLEDFDL